MSIIRGLFGKFLVYLEKGILCRVGKKKKKGARSIYPDMELSPINNKLNNHILDIYQIP